MRRKFSSVVAGIAIVALPAVVLAHGGATGIVKERMDLMKSMGDSMKILGMMLAGKGDHDPATIETAATEIARLGGEKMTALFPEGSLDAPSEALAAIWEDWAEFEAIAGLTQDYGAALAAAAHNPPADAMLRPDDVDLASGDPALLADAPPQEAFAYLARTCSSCHESFRMKK
jgi:cytochrome c556